MGKGGKIRPQQIQKAQKLLTGLPEKECCSREKAVDLLAKDLRKAFQKGYTPKEICALLRKDGIILGEQLVTRFMEHEAGEKEIADGMLPQRREQADMTQDVAPSGGDYEKQNQKSNGANLTEKKQDCEVDENANHDLTITKEQVLHSRFEIIPDTPLGEL